MLTPHCVRVLSAFTSQSALRRVVRLASSRLYTAHSSEPSSTELPKTLINFKSISADDLGPSILYRNEAGRRVSANGSHELLNRGVFVTKVLSLSSSALGLVMVPVLTSFFWEAASEQPNIMLFAVVANTFLSLLSLTPFLLQFLVKRFIVDLFYNPSTKVFTSVHYGLVLNKRALRFRVEHLEDAAQSPLMGKLWLPLATVFVHQRPLLLSLDPNSYVDPAAFRTLTQNVHIPPGSD